METGGQVSIPMECAEKVRPPSYKLHIKVSIDVLMGSRALFQAVIPALPCLRTCMRRSAAEAHCKLHAAGHSPGDIVLSSA